MPPKLPNLKYKPKRVVRTKDDSEAAETGAGVEDLSLIQLERLRLQQETQLQQQQQQQQQQRGNMHSARFQNNPQATTTAGDNNNNNNNNNNMRKINKLQSDPMSNSRAAAYLAAEADRFPANTMSKILEAEADNPNMIVYHPTPLDCTLPARLKNKEIEGEIVDGDDQRIESTTPNEDGTMFLKEYDEELKRSRQANLRFEREVLNPSANKIDMETVVGNNDGGELVWFQLPRFQAETPFVLTQLPPGKIGEVKVYKSGRMVMEICGVYYDIAVEGYTAGGDGACNVATAIVPSQQSDGKPSCYQLGMLEKKMVCTPSITVDK